jgi:hypothetical protein
MHVVGIAVSAVTLKCAAGRRLSMVNWVLDGLKLFGEFYACATGEKMTRFADDVRKYACDHYVTPARSAGQKTVTIRVGDVHKALGYKDRLPLVATALSAMKFRNENKLTLIKTEGPGQSTTTTYIFEVN